MKITFLKLNMAFVIFFIVYWCECTRVECNDQRWASQAFCPDNIYKALPRLQFCDPNNVEYYTTHLYPCATMLFLLLKTILNFNLKFFLYFCVYVWQYEIVTARDTLKLSKIGYVWTMKQDALGSISSCNACLEHSDC